eukprot:2191018-Lingulodinium_polyedra.AAC.1
MARSWAQPEPLGQHPCATTGGLWHSAAPVPPDGGASRRNTPSYCVAPEIKDGLPSRRQHGIGTASATGALRANNTA